ncbi:hypothetical protein OHD62_18595 [Mesorhizobium sp. YC-39]|uniref:hypothetical protein n=1 Tax=unclassified Mesorhizobium TaxID=325217 RepID=UPI0021E817D4|nr:MULTISPECIES: hypothetical protein [unclassified Mesorhizobium]MCV3209853.1 hypothetical protein [Mesorhizobium sp. YC-2]MCV3230383.1 hypothetical protein [Mesorhizobium sp. YC-39]
MASKYWFARHIRRNYMGHDRYRKGAMPISWEGNAVIAGFIAALVIGGLIMLLMAVYTTLFPLGIALFVVLAVAGAGTFIWAVATRSDPDKSIADYKAERQRARSSGS